jgi:hypothetical protein
LQPAKAFFKNTILRRQGSPPNKSPASRDTDVFYQNPDVAVSQLSLVCDARLRILLLYADDSFKPSRNILAGKLLVRL